MTGMDVKHKRLAAIAAAAVAVAGGAGVVYVVTRPPKEPTYPLFVDTPESKAAWARATGMVPSPPRNEKIDLKSRPRVALRDLDHHVLDYLKTSSSAPGDDVLPKEVAKVTVGKQGEDVEVTIDLDRDGRVEERWSIRAETTRRVVAMAPRGRGEYFLDGDEWALVRGNGQTMKVEPPTEPAPQPPAEVALRPMDKEILDYVARQQRQPAKRRVPDAFPKAPYQVEINPNRDRTRFERVNIDLDRDRKWDEEWQIEAQEVSRKLLPGGAKYGLKKGKWVKI